MKTIHAYRWLGFLMVLPLLVLVADGASAHSPKRRPPPPPVAPPVQVAPTDGLPAWSVPPLSLHPCGSRTTATPSVEIQRATYSAAAEHGVDPVLMFAIFRGESEYNPRAVNAIRTRKGHARGLGQHLEGYWSERVSQFQRSHPTSRLAGTSIYDIQAQTRITAWMLAGGMGRNAQRAWNC